VPTSPHAKALGIAKIVAKRRAETVPSADSGILATLKYALRRPDRPSRCVCGEHASL